MTQLTSNPVVPPMPNRPQYGLYDIATVHHFTDRAEFQRVYFVQAKPFDHTKRPKFWFRTDQGSDPNKLVSYNTLGKDSNGQPALLPQVITAAELAEVNIPGGYIYPPYVMQPTSALLQLNNVGMPVGIREVSLEAQAQAMVNSLQPVLPNLQLKYREGKVAPPDSYVYPDLSDPRRVYEVYDALSDKIVGNVGELLYIMNAFGVGAPGHWQIGFVGNPFWKDDHTIDQPSDPTLMVEWPVPVRDLLPVEKPVLSTLAGVVAIQRTDLLPQVPADGSATGAGYTDADRTRDNETHAWMMNLAKKLGL